MEFKVITFLTCVALASAGLLPQKSYLENFEETDGHPRYEFNYNVDDSETGDVKSQRESRDGENVQGQYTINDADGYKRIVDYSVNGESGFNAVVRREPLTDNRVILQQPIVAPKPVEVTTAQPLIAPKPIFKSIVQPAYLRTTVLHHHQPTVYHTARSVQLSPSTHILHSAPTTTFVKSSPAVITTHHSPSTFVHHSPAVVHHAPAAVVHHHAPAAALVHHHTPSFASQQQHHQVSYVHYH